MTAMAVFEIAAHVKALAPDPATGSAHCVLTPYWAGRLAESRLSARQVSPRSGELWLEIRDDRVYLSGHCVAVMQRIVTF